MNQELHKALQALQKNQLVLLIDDVTDQPGGYLVTPADSVSEEDIALMVNAGRGVVCAALSEATRTELGLPMMMRTPRTGTPDFTVSVEARQGVSTGISAADRAQTLRTLATTTNPKLDLVTPGHIFPWRAKAGGVLVRNTAAEATVDLLTLAGVKPIGALVQCLTEQGTLPTAKELDALATQLKIPKILISDITRHRMATEPLIEKIASARLPTSTAGEFTAVCFKSKIDEAEHLALVRGNLNERDKDGLQVPLPVRVQAEQRIVDLLGDGRCSSSRAKLDSAMQRIAAAGRGVVVYIRHPRSKMVREHLAATARQGSTEPGTTEADEKDATSETSAQLRELGIGAQILNYLGVERIILLTNSTREIRGIEAFQLEIVRREEF